MLLRLKSGFYKILRRISRKERSLDMGTMIPFYKEIWQNAAKQIGAEVKELSGGIWQVSYDGRTTLIDNYKVQIDDPVVLSVAGNKCLCYSLMKEKGLPVPEYQVFGLDSIHRAKSFMENHPGNLFVIKPAIGTSGARGVTTHIRSYQECVRGTVLASLYCSKILIERWIPGESYRLLILGGRMIHAARRQGLRVHGDGNASVGELVGRENARRRIDIKKQLPIIADSDRDYLSTLYCQSISPNSILDAGHSILVRSWASPHGEYDEDRTVFDEDVTDIIGEGLREQALRAAQAVGSQFAGVDVISLDPCRPLDQTGGAINEINTTPGLHHHYNLANEHGSPAVAVLKYLLGL
jgi:cyanophycin synthetase